MNEWVAARSETIVCTGAAEGELPLLPLLLLLLLATLGGGETVGRDGTGVAAADGFGGVDWVAIV
jgi:hypothetical protein